MILALAGYLGAFGLAWWHVAANGFPWTLFLWLCPAVWGAGLGARAPAALRIGLYAAVGLSVWTALLGEALSAIGIVTLTLWAWDAAGLSMRLAQAREVTDRRGVWVKFLVKSSTASVGAVAVAVGFSWLRVSIPFLGLVGLLAGTLTALYVFRRAALPGNSL